MFNININSGLDVYEVTTEIYLNDDLVQRQTIQAPHIIHKSQYLNLIQQIANDKRPMKFRMIKPDIIWDQFEQKQKVLNNYIEFSNKAMEARQ